MPEPEQDPGGGSSLSMGVFVLLAIAAGVVFWAGLTLGGQTIGRNDTERTAIEAFTETYRHISDQFVGESDPEDLLEAAICGMFDTLEDPYSVCMGPDEYETRFEDVSGQFGGIGAVMNTEDLDGEPCEVIGEACRLVVVEVLSEAPAEAAGLMAGDAVVAADGESLDGLTIDDSVFLIRGPEGSDVTVTLERDGETQDLTVTRDLIVTQDVRSAEVADGRVGYVRIDNFSANSADDVEQALRDHLDAGVESLILDVRGDPGGFVDAAVEITSEFVASGPVYWEEDAAGNQSSVNVSGNGIATDPDLSLVVLVDGGSASASELVAGALQDAGRATLVGEPTFGKGTVQEWTELPGDSGGFRLSVAKWLTRDKRWIEGEGLQPDAFVRPAGTVFRPVEGADPTADSQVAYAIALLLDEPLPSAEPLEELPVDVVVDPSGTPDMTLLPSPSSPATHSPSPSPAG